MNAATRVAGALLVCATTAGIFTPTAHADYNPGCTSQFWMVGLRATTRTICDGPIQADGTWMRTRTFYAPAHTAAGWSSCYGGLYYSNCFYTPPRQVPEFTETATYPVTATTVLADEPNHIGEGQLSG